MQNTSLRNSAALRDLLVLSITVAVVFGLAFELEAFERLRSWLIGAGVQEEVDDILVVASVLVAGFAIFAWRRWSDLRRTLRALAASEARARQLVAHSLDGILLHDEHGRVVEWSPAAEAILGVSRAEALGRFGWELQYRLVPEAVRQTTPDLPERLRASFNEMLRTGRSPWPEEFIEVTLQRPDGAQRLVAQSVYFIPGEKGYCVGSVVRDVTSARQAEAALRASERRLRGLFDYSPFPIWEEDFSAVAVRFDQWRADGARDFRSYLDAHPEEVVRCAGLIKVTAVNQTSLRFFGVSSPAASAAALPVYYAADSWEVFKEALIALGEGRQRFESELSIRTQTGDRRTLFLTLAVVPGEGQLLGRILTSLVEITERRQAEAALRASDGRYRALFEQASDGIFLTDLNGQLLDVNSAGCAMLGYARPELLGRSLQDLFPPEEWRSAPWHLNAMQPGETVLSERNVLTQAGQRLLAEISGRRVEGDLFQGIIRDITQRKQSEERLRQLSRAVEQSPASIIITDLTGTIQYVNPKFTAVTGYTFQEAQGRKPSMLKSGETGPEEYRQLWQTILAGGEWRGEFHNRKKNGELFWEAALLSGIKDDAGQITHLLAVKEDITERVSAQAELAAVHAQLEEALWEANQLAIAAQAANRLKSEILANTSHELRTPLTVISSSLDLVLQGVCPSPAEEHSFLEAAQTAARNLHGMINNLLDLAQIEAGRMEVIPGVTEVGVILSELARLYQGPARERHLTLTLPERPAQAVWVAAEPGKVRQILMGMLNNALKFTPAGGVSVTVEVEAQVACAHLRVRDTGIGVPLAQQARLFEPFVQGDGATTRRHGGVGLGLSIARQLAELMDGSLTLYSAGEGQGCTVTLTLPLSPSAGPA